MQHGHYYTRYCKDDSFFHTDITKTEDFKMKNGRIPIISPQRILSTALFSSMYSILRLSKLEVVLLGVERP